LEDNIRVIINEISEITTQEEVSEIAGGIRELINKKVQVTEFLHKTYNDSIDIVSKSSKRMKKMNIEQLII
jgi:hypothetical protein